MYKGSIIDLENASYLVLEETQYGTRNIILATQVDTNSDVIDTENLLIKEVKEIDGSLEIVSLTDQYEIEELTKLLLTKYKMNN